VQAIKALRAGPLHNHLVRERPKIVPELYEQSEVQHFCKLEQQRKVAKLDKAPRSCYNNNQRNYPKHMYSIDSDVGGPPENWDKNFIGPPQERNTRTFDQRSFQHNQRGGVSNRGRGRVQGPYTVKPPHCMYHGSETNHHTKDCPSTLRQKENGVRFCTTFTSIYTLRSQPYHAMGFTTLAIFLILAPPPSHFLA
jgi:hypothetical protein